MVQRLRYAMMMASVSLFWGALAAQDCNLNGIPDALDLRPHFAMDAALEYAAPNPSGVTVGDFDGDGTLDAAVMGDYPPTVAVLLNTGDDGRLELAGNTPLDDKALDIASADFDGDGLLDVVVITNGRRPVVVFFGEGNGELVLPLDFDVGDAGGFPQSLVAEDFDDDGSSDLAVAIGDVCCPEIPGSLVVLINDGRGLFLVQPSIVGGPDPQVLLAVNLAGDPGLDLVVAGEGEMGVLTNRGGGRFTVRLGFPGISDPYALASGDFDGDGDIDLAVASVSTWLLRNLGSVFSAQQGVRVFPE